MATPTLTKDKFDILKVYKNEMIISIDKDLRNKIYDEYIEDKEMNKNKVKLVKNYEKSLKSGIGLTI